MRAREWICMQIASNAAINGALHTRRASFHSFRRWERSADAKTLPEPAI